jgi:hypothetical protein
MRRDPTGTVIGLLTFLGGIAVLTLVFKLAFDIVYAPPAEALGIKPGQAIDPNVHGVNLVWILIRFLLLLVMGAVGSWIANRGVNLLGASLGPREVDASRSHQASKDS